MKGVTGIWIVLLYMVEYMWSQTESGIHFLPVPQASWTNPALVTTGWLIGLPSISAGFIQPSLPLDRAIKKIGGQQILDLADLSFVAGEDGHLQGTINTESLLFTYRKERWSWSLGHKAQGALSVLYPQDGLSLLVHGNALFAGRRIGLNHEAEGQAWHKISAGVGYHLPWLDAGIRINRYLGLACFKTNRGQGSFYTDALGYQLDVQADVSYSSAGVWWDKNLLTNTWYGEWRGQAGAGWGGDIGVQLLITPRWSIAASWINVGQILWNKNSQELTLKQDWSFRGVNIVPPFKEGTLESFDLPDTIYHLNWITAPTSFRSATPSEVYISLRHHFTQHWMASILFAGPSNGKLKPSIYSARIGYRRVPGPETSLALTYNRWAAWQVGWHGGWSFKGGQLFLVSDHVLSFLTARPWQGAHLRLGAALKFGQEGRKKIN